MNQTMRPAHQPSTSHENTYKKRKDELQIRTSKGKTIYHTTHVNSSYSMKSQM
jgi:hypothetical protein